MTSFEDAISSSSSSNTQDHQASPADLFWKTHLKDGNPCSVGTDPKVALDILVNNRVGGLNAVPYYASEQCGSPSSSTAFGITSYRILSATDTDTIKSAIASNHPVAIAAETYTDFQSWGNGGNTGVYQGNGIVRSDGAHCMLVVGYDDSLGAWRIQNSWSTGWGDNGRFWMSYATFANTVAAAYVAEGGSNVNPTPNPSGTVTFTSFDALQYQSVSTGIYYIVHPFTLSEPLLVTQGRLTYENTGGTTGWLPVNQVMYSSYVWWSSVSPFPPGNYSVEFQGITSDGRSVTVKGTHTLHNGGFVRSAPQHVEASQSVLKVIRSLGGTPTTIARLLPGTRVVANGHAVTLTSK